MSCHSQNRLIEFGAINDILTELHQALQHLEKAQGINYKAQNGGDDGITITEALLDGPDERTYPRYTAYRQFSQLVLLAREFMQTVVAKTNELAMRQNLPMADASVVETGQLEAANALQKIAQVLAEKFSVPRQLAK